MQKTPQKTSIGAKTPSATQAGGAAKKPKRRGVFISYRQLDAAGTSGHIYDRLKARYGEQHVFQDVNSLEGGSKFAQVISERIARSAVMLVIIGQQWLDIRDKHGRRRLEQPDDPVREEVEAAVDQGVEIVPVLVEGAKMPEVRDLPKADDWPEDKSLKLIPALQAVVVNGGPDFEAGMQRLVKRVDAALPPGMRPAVRRRRFIYSIVGALAVLAVVAAGVRQLSAAPPATPYRGAVTANDTLKQVVTDPSGGLWAVGQHPSGAGGAQTSFVLHDVNGTWLKVYTAPAGVALDSMAMASPGEGWAVGSHGTILHYSGGTWTQVGTSPATTADLHHAVLSSSGTEGWAVGSGGTFVHYTGGEWSVVPSPTNLDLEGVAVTATGGEAWAVGASATLLHYSAGVWSIFANSSGGVARLHGVALTASGSEGWAVGDIDTILHYTSAAGWSPVTLPATVLAGVETLNSVAMTASGSEAWIVGGDGTILQNSGGDWNAAGNNPTHQTLNGVALSASGSDAWMVGSSGTILRHQTSSAWTPIVGTTTNGSGPGIGSVTVTPTGSEAWVTTGLPGRTSPLWHYAGIGWILDSYALDFADMRGVVMPASGSEAWAVGGNNGGSNGGRIMHYAGGKWSVASFDSADNLFAYLIGVALTPSGGEGWAVGDGGTILHYTSTVGWHVVSSSPTHVRLRGVAMTASGSEAWAVGEEGTILHYAAGHWTQVGSHTTNTLNMVAVTSSGSEAWAVGDGGTILHESGGEWSSVASGLTGNRLNGVAVTPSGSEAWVVGDGAVFLHYLAGSWSVLAQPPGVKASLLAVAVTATGGKAWAVGDSGPILHYRASDAWDVVNGPTVTPTPTAG